MLAIHFLAPNTLRFKPYICMCLLELWLCSFNRQWLLSVCPARVPCPFERERGCVHNVLLALSSLARPRFLILPMNSVRKKARDQTLAVEGVEGESDLSDLLYKTDLIPIRIYSKTADKTHRTLCSNVCKASQSGKLSCSRALTQD